MLDATRPSLLQACRILADFLNAPGITRKIKWVYFDTMTHGQAFKGYRFVDFTCYGKNIYRAPFLVYLVLISAINWLVLKFGFGGSVHVLSAMNRSRRLVWPDGNGTLVELRFCQEREIKQEAEETVSWLALILAASRKRW